MSSRPLMSLHTERWPVAGRFAISRGAVTEVEVVRVSITDGDVTGQGEGVPYARYGETVRTACDALNAMAEEVARGLTREALRHRMPPGAARNALDAALWDFDAKQRGVRVWELAGLPAPQPLVTAYTLSLESPEAMGAAARRAAERPWLKIKLGGGALDVERLQAVRRNAPSARLLVDANEGWDAAGLPAMLAWCHKLRVEMVEQPLPADADEGLRGLRSPVPICADESAHGLDTLAGLIGKYAALNIKLDKTGGLTEALSLREAARSRGLRIMVGCMLSTSLSMAPAILVGQGADVVDLDGPLLLARDREPPMSYQGSRLFPPPQALWG